MIIEEPKLKDGKWRVVIDLHPEKPIVHEMDFDTEEEALKFYKLNLWVNEPNQPSNNTGDK